MYQHSIYRPQNRCTQQSSYCIQTNSTSSICSRYAFRDLLNLFLNSNFSQYIIPTTFTLYTPYLTTSQDATTITNPCFCQSDLLKFNDSSNYDALPLCDLTSFSVLVQNPLTNLPKVKELLSKLFPYNTICNNSCCNTDSYDCHVGIENYLLEKQSSLKVASNDTKLAHPNTTISTMAINASNVSASSFNGLNILVNDANFVGLDLIGLANSLACFTQVGMTPQSPPIPYVSIVIINTLYISALGT